MTNWWVSWCCPSRLMGKFELHLPWWVSGETAEDSHGAFSYTICAAVRADDEDGAREVVVASHDALYREDARQLAWRFVEERPDDWSPFNDRFPRADWMQW